MAAPSTLSKTFLTRNSVTKTGVVTLFGYGIKVTVERGHLVLDGGIGTDRHRFRLARVAHGLKRLVIVGSDGFVSLAALEWLANQNAAFVMLERDGRVLATTGPVRPSDARLRRAQAVASYSEAGLLIARELISHKLTAQEQLAQDQLNAATVARKIAHCRAELTTATTIDSVRLLESQAAAVYWSAWHPVHVNFPRKHLARVPEHWRTFGTRKSPLSGSPRLAANAANAILNYLYAILEAESRLAAAALGLDPGLGFLHVDTPARDSLACDLMEPVRPQVDAFLLDWITREALAREWFFEQPNGNARLMGTFAAKLAQTASTWARAVAPYAEWVARTLWAGRLRSESKGFPPTRLTQRRKRESRGRPPFEPLPKLPYVERRCRDCGKPISADAQLCRDCSDARSRERMGAVAEIGRRVAHTREAETRRANTLTRHWANRRNWDQSGSPDWLTEEVYATRIQPALGSISTSDIASALGVSLYYASDIRRGRCCPHPRHWHALAQLAGISPPE